MGRRIHYSGIAKAMCAHEVVLVTKSPELCEADLPHSRITAFDRSIDVASPAWMVRVVTEYLPGAR